MIHTNMTRPKRNYVEVSQNSIRDISTYISVTLLNSCVLKYFLHSYDDPKERTNCDKRNEILRTCPGRKEQNGKVTAT